MILETKENIRKDKIITEKLENRSVLVTKTNVSYERLHQILSNIYYD